MTRGNNLDQVRQRMVMALLILGIIAAFFLMYRLKIFADSVTPGTATTTVHLEANVSSNGNLTVKTSFYPTSGGTYYFANRTFSVAAGKNKIDWTIKKVPAGKYKAIVSTGGDFFQPGRYVTLGLNQATNAGRFIYYDDGTTVSHYLAEKGTQNPSSYGYETDPNATDCGLASYNDNAIGYGAYTNPCFLANFKKCSPAKVTLNDGVSNQVLEIIGPDSNMCKVNGWVESADATSQYKVGQTLACKLDSTEGLGLSLDDALSDYHKKHNYALNRAEVCSGSYFDAMKKTYTDNYSSAYSNTSVF